MTYQELNNYILHYITEDKTKSAIMLSGQWGIGKSHYIQNDLIPYLNNDKKYFISREYNYYKKREKYKTVVVSLYGLSDTSEIGKNIYISSRLNNLYKNTEAAATIRFLGKPIITSLFNRVNIDISKSDKEIKELCESVKLKNTLIILEDVERSKIDILDVLGYVNNLVEQDWAKVLLVTNENEFLKYIEEETKEGNKTKITKSPDEVTEKYLKIKEKTISDTIIFNGDIKSNIKDILKIFGSELESFISEESISDISDIFILKNCYNLRSFIFACQKTSYIFELISDKLNAEERKNIFYSIIAFSFTIKDGDIPNWDGDEYLSVNFGIKGYPLYHFCYDFIKDHNLNQDNIMETFSKANELRLFIHHKEHYSDEDINKLNSWAFYTENEIMTVLENVLRRLDNSNDIAFSNYEQLIKRLCSLKFVLGVDIEPYRKKIINNAKGKGSLYGLNSLGVWANEIEAESERKEYIDFCEKIKNALYENQEYCFNFHYLPSELEDFCNSISKSEIIPSHKFISRFNVKKLGNMFFECHPKQLLFFRYMMRDLYEYTSRDEFNDSDRISMIELKESIDSTLEAKSGKIDKILAKNIEWLISDLGKYIEQLS